MLSSGSLVLALAGSQALAARLFVASYTGEVSTLSLDEDAHGTYSLKVIASTMACAANASWITLDHQRDTLFCADRGLVAKNGTLNSLKIQKDGSLVALDRSQTPVGAAATTMYANNTALAVAYFSSSSVGSFDISSASKIRALQHFEHSMATPGPNAQLQSAPHPHHAITDPTDSYVLVPDLGADLVRVYRIDHATRLLEPLAPFTTPTGSGPRHGSWLVTRSHTYFYLVGQLANTLTGYEVTYNSDKTLSFERKFVKSLLETTTPGVTLQFWSAAAGIVVSPDNKFLLVSQRNDTHFSIPNPSSPSSATKIPSDSLLTYSLDQSNGKASLISIDAAGGSFARQFSINKAGDLVAVGLQNDGRVAILKRDVKTGKNLEIVAGIDLKGQIVCMVWDE
ncbi:hypothetical protein DSL72_006904 [Monilinia vaccinii-corymbosi]|uniref:6-phosphogluconolactonase n=1 Tax=Monilinia vaccinii-corymbosi TaxID=61207 RepID=A0A8A3PK98_9HELO|nr:hypothetical protein DSL72_006904 [Monilinia vaccinii-corymbosi]